VHFKYTGIPLVGKGYQNAHIEGNCALLSFLPLNIKGTAIRNGPLRSNFLSAAAALLGVPQRYEQLLIQQQLQIHNVRRSEPYMEAQFSTARKLGIEQVARFLAWNGVPPDEAEQWRPWATAYIEMELIERPNSMRAPILKQAKDLARKCITDNPTFILKSVHVDALGNYNPALEQSQEVQSSQLASHEQMADTTHPMTPFDFAQTYTAQLDKTGISLAHGWDDEDTRMGPG
jgi:hypothetical protein